ncbi:type VI secretion system tube protein TssD [Hymenobacter terrenus]|uniref:type VI secretion system tube protein TssD n=1 Tax=Hymenobacter terrenus TaxID=1629124 RepID=UPI00061A0513|nr:type VI secretion system tube protein TssD [Hymenobacter terrenus]
MASSYAELHLEGFAFPVLRCSYCFHQVTDERGRAMAKVRHEPLHLHLNVPDAGSELLLNWAITPFKALAGRLFSTVTSRCACRR